MQVKPANKAFSACQNPMDDIRNPSADRGAGSLEAITWRGAWQSEDRAVATVLAACRNAVERIHAEAHEDVDWLVVESSVEETLACVMNEARLLKPSAGCTLSLCRRTNQRGPQMAKATTKRKPAAKKTAVKKTAAKKAVRKTAAKKTAAKKTAAKKTVAKKATRKTAVKKTARKTAVKKTAVKKTAVKKSAVKKSAVKKTAVKKATRKTAVKKTAVKKTAVKKVARKAPAKKRVARKPKAAAPAPVST